MAVIGVRNAGLRGLKLNVRLPDGSSCWLPVPWTSLGRSYPGVPRLAGSGSFCKFKTIYSLIKSCLRS